MPVQSQLSFTKMHGAGNDIVLLDLRDAPAPSPELCRALSDRHTGVGCDMILGVEAPRSLGAAASYRIWTGDGLVSKQCGNGARCVAAWVIRAGVAQGPKFALDSPSGMHAVDVLEEQTFRIAMGVPQFEPKHIPLTGFEDEQEVYEIDLDSGRRLSFSAVSMGNPHAVIEVDNIKSALLEEVGQELQKSRYLPGSVNVGFVEIVSRKCIKLRVYEYGAGETLACGSGACAAVAILIRRGLCERDVTVNLPGGVLNVGWHEDNSQIMMTGPAAFVFEGVFPLE